MECSAELQISLNEGCGKKLQIPKKSKYFKVLGILDIFVVKFLIKNAKNLSININFITLKSCVNQEKKKRLNIKLSINKNFLPQKKQNKMMN